MPIPTGGKITIEQFKFRGFKKLEKALEQLTEDNFRQNALRASGRAAMQPLLEQLKNEAPRLKSTSILPKDKLPNALADGLRMKVSVNKNPKVTKTGKVTKASKSELRVVITTGKESEGYALVSEYGRKETPIYRYMVFGRQVPAFQVMLPTLEPKPWMRPTFDRMKGDTIFKFRQELKKQIAKKAKAQERKLSRI